MAIKIYTDRRISPDIRIKADFDQASSNIAVQGIGEDPEYGDWQPTVFQVADFRHIPRRALRGVSKWLERQREWMIALLGVEHYARIFGK